MAVQRGTFLERIDDRLLGAFWSRRDDSPAALPPMFPRPGHESDCSGGTPSLALSLVRVGFLRCFATLCMQGQRQPGCVLPFVETISLG